MTDLSQIVRWNAGFVRGLAQSVLERAKSIRSTLTAYSDDAPVAAAAPKKMKKPATAKRGAARKSTAKRAPARRAPKRADA